MWLEWQKTDNCKKTEGKNYNIKAFPKLTAECPRPLPMKTASSGGTERGWAPGMGSEMTRLDLEVWRGLVPPRAVEPICWARSIALSGSLLGSEQACSHTGIFWVRRSLPWKQDRQIRESYKKNKNRKYGIQDVDMAGIWREKKKKGSVKQFLC